MIRTAIGKRAAAFFRCKILKRHTWSRPKDNGLKHCVALGCDAVATVKRRIKKEVA